MGESKKTKDSGRMIVEGFLFLMLFVFPLFFHDYYFDITYTKYSFFCNVSLLSAILYFFVGKVSMGSIKGTLVSTRFLFYLLFLAAGFVGMVLSPYYKSVFSGSAGRYNGWFTCLLYALVMVMISCEGKISLYCLDAAQLCAIAVGLLGILNHYGVDPLGFYIHISVEQQSVFTSTIGNIDIFGEYISVVFVIASAFYCLLGKRLYFITAFVCSAAILTNDAEGAFIGLFFFVLFFPVMTKDRKEFMRYVLMLMVCGINLLIVSLAEEMLTQSKGLSYIVSVLGSYRKENVAVILFLGAVYLLLQKRVKVSDVFCRGYKWLLAAGVIGVAALFFLFNTGILKVSENSFLNCFIITDSWGSSRGRIWKAIWKGYDGLPFLQKLFGIGADCLSYLEEAKTLSLFVGKQIDNAHNLYLQLLVCHGIIGLAGWIGFLLTSLYQGFKKCKKQRSMLPIVMGVAAYYLEAFVGIHAIHISAYVMILVGMMSVELE